jgi:hypothetical protein
MKRTYHLWKNNCTGIKEEALDTNQDYYIGIDTGTKYSKKEYYISNYKKARIKSVDEINKTGMYHLYAEINDEEDENNSAFKLKYVNAIVSVKQSHYSGEHIIYYCHELSEYFSDDEIEILE